MSKITRIIFAGLSLSIITLSSLFLKTVPHLLRRHLP